MSGNFYYAYKNEGAYLIRRENSPIGIMTKKVSDSDEIQIFTSIAINKNILQKISDKIKNVLFTPLSSALKFGAIASGEGSFYPRLGPTHEWDTAAGQCLIEEAGGIVVDRNMNRLKYNKNSNFLNEEFFVIGDPSYDWKPVIDRHYLREETDELNAFLFSFLRILYFPYLPLFHVKWACS